MPSGDDEQTPRELKTSEGGSTETGSKNEAEKVNLRAEAPTPDEINQPIEHVAVNAYEERASGGDASDGTPKAEPDSGVCATSGEKQQEGKSQQEQPQNQALEVSGFPTGGVPANDVMTRLAEASPMGAEEEKTLTPLDQAMDPALDPGFARAGAQGLVMRSLCKFWQEGTCRNGTTCTWAHGEHELGAPAPLEGAKPQVKRTLCRFWMEGKCRDGHHCTWAHGGRQIGTPVLEPLAVSLNPGLPPLVHENAQEVPPGPRLEDDQVNQVQQAWQNVEMALSDVNNLARRQTCKFWLDGRCRNGDRCDWAHGDDGLAAMAPMLQQQLHQLQQQLQPQLPQLQQLQQQQMLPQQQQQMLPLRPRVEETLLPRPLWKGSVDLGAAPEAQIPRPLWKGTATTEMGPPLDASAMSRPLWNGSSEFSAGTLLPPLEDSHLLAIAEQQLQESASNYKGLKRTVCKFWQQGLCERGDACTFLHGEQDIHPNLINGNGVGTGIAAPVPLPTEAERICPLDPPAFIEAPLGAITSLNGGMTVKRTVCRFWQQGLCERGEDCTFAHGEGEIGTPVISRSPMPDVAPRGPPFMMMPGRSVSAASSGPFGHWAEPAKPTSSLALGWQLQQQQPPSRRVPCKFWLQGLCERGVNCLWPHEDTEPIAPPSVPPLWARSHITHPPSLPPKEHLVVFSSIRPVEPTLRRTICKFWQEGKCSRGVGCTFAHGEQEIGTVADTSRRLAPPMAAAQPVQPALPLFDASREPCRFHLAGCCHKGSLCPFPHVGLNQAKRPRIS